MGGVGSGGNNRLSDDEKKKRGTFRDDPSDCVCDAVAATRVVSGPWLTASPEQELPLSDIGRKKYDELTKILFDSNKLTTVTRMLVEQVASLHQEIHRRMSASKPVPASLTTQMRGALAQLKIAEDAPAIANPAGKINKFTSCGFSSRISATRGFR